MNVRFLELARSVRTLRPELDAALAAVLDDAVFLQGTAVEAFERAFAEYCGAEHAVAVASGTAAISIALEAAGIGPGHEVLTAANTCVPTVAAIEATGAVPVLVDADAATRTLDPGLLAEATTERTRAIVPVHLYGRCAEIEPILEHARSHGLVVVEDAAQGHGAESSQGRAGTLGLAAAFSFYPTKNLGALGDGGAVVTSDAELAERARRLRSYGERRRYDSVVRGTNSRLASVQAAALLVKLPRLEAWNERWRSLAAFYRAALADVPIELPAEPAVGRHVFHLFVVRAAERERLRTELAARGVETLVHYPRAVHQHPAYAHLDRPGRLGTSETLAREVLSLPLYPELTDGEAEAVAAAVTEAAAGLGAPPPAVHSPTG
jgi:dTDP-3-amino-3,4,6-trideoxy-alpha-D-glucose transaminase